MEKISAAFKTQRLNEWKTAFPDYTRVGNNKLVKLMPPFVFSIELVLGKYDNNTYVPYVGVGSLLSSLLAIPGVCINRQSKFDDGKKVIYLDTLQSYNLSSDVIEIARKNFEPVMKKDISVSYLIQLFESELATDRAIFGTHFSIYRALLYLYSIAPIGNEEKQQHKQRILHEIRAKEEGFRRIYKEFYDPLLEQAESFISDPKIVNEEIEKSIEKFKLNKMLRHELNIV